MASYGCLSIQNKSVHQAPVTSHWSFIISFTRHQSPGIQAWIKSPGIPYQSPVIQSPGIQAGIKSPGIYHPVNYARVLVSGHCDGLLVTPTRQQLRVLVSDHCVALRGMFEMYCLFLSGDFKFQVSPKVLYKYSFHALEVLPVARNAKFQPMYPLLEGVTVR